MTKHCINCGKPDPGIHTCYDVFAKATGQFKTAADARMKRIRELEAIIKKHEKLLQRL